jgi:hypothetical protein
MAETSIIMASDTRAFQRLDAEFHEARTRVAARTARLEREHTADQAVALMDGLEIESLQCLAPLLRGTQRVTAVTARKAMRDHPHIALALVQEGVHQAIEDKEAQIGRHGEELDRLRAILPRD